MFEVYDMGPDYETDPEKGRLLMSVATLPRASMVALQICRVGRYALILSTGEDEDPSVDRLYYPQFARQERTPGHFCYRLRCPVCGQMRMWPKTTYIKSEGEHLRPKTCNQCSYPRHKVVRALPPSSIRMDKRVYSCSEAAILLNVPTKRIMDYIKKGEIEAYKGEGKKPGRQAREYSIPAESIRALLRRREEEANEARQMAA